MSITDDARRLADAASPGPWIIETHTDFEWGEAAAITNVCGPIVTGEDGIIYPLAPADAQFIAWCRTGVPVLVDDNEALRAENKRLRTERDAQSRAFTSQALRDRYRRAMVAERLLASIRDWTISASHQAEGERINVEYGDGCKTAFPVNTPKTIGEIIADHDRTWPHSSVGAAVLGTDQEQAPTEQPPKAIVTVTVDGAVMFVGAAKDMDQLTITHRKGQPAWLRCNIPDLSASC